LLTFFFHRVLDKPDPMMPGEIDARQFDQILTWIGEQFRVLAPRDACEQWLEGALPSRAAIISFDDGYRDNHDVAMPILRHHRMQAAFFIATGYLGNGVQFNDRLTEAFRRLDNDSFDAGWLGLGVLPTGSLSTRLHTLEQVREAAKYLDPAARWQAVERIESICGLRPGDPRSAQRERVMMTPEEVAALFANGMEIGGHTVTHPILQSIDDAAAFDEIRSGRDALAALVGHAPSLFAYPNGKLGADFDLRHAQMARRAGFEYAFSTERGVATKQTDAMLMPRFMPWDTKALRFKLQALRVTAGH
jgi:peptidoglycan/xylan/chitin deacetylase (PgdA/CDA1 family)